jgi:SAM-dependent methyltransferase
MGAKMRDAVIGYIKKIIQANEILGPVLDLGGLLAEEQECEYGGVIEKLFQGKDYKTLDLRPGADIVGDVHDTRLPSESFGTVLLLETLEHLEYPQMAVTEMYRIIKPGGLAIITTLMCWEEHRCPRDFWRFLPDGLLHLLTEARFASIEVETDGIADSPSGIFVLGRKGK